MQPIPWNRTRAAAMAAAVLLLGACGGGDDPVDPPDATDHPPTLPLITSNTTQYALLPGEHVTLTAVSTDQDGDPLTFTWALSGSSPGALSTTEGAATVWTAGLQPGTAQAMVTVSDGLLSRSSAPITFLIGTPAGGTLDDPTVWSADASPYVLTDDLVVLTDATLTIAPGVQVVVRKKLQQGNPVNVEIRISGTLIAQGTSAAQGITFRAASLVDASNAQYNGLEFEAGSHATLTHVRIERAATAITNRGSNHLNLFACQFSRCGGGLRVTNGALMSLRGSKIDRCSGAGVAVIDSELRLRNCTVQANGGPGINVLGQVVPATVSLDSCIVDANEGFNLILGTNSIASVDSTNFFLKEGAKDIDFAAAGGPSVDLRNCYWGLLIDATDPDGIKFEIGYKAINSFMSRPYEVVPHRNTPWSLPLAPP